MTNESLKGLPVNELSLAAVCVVLGFNPDVGEGGSVETEMDVIDQKLWDTFKPLNKPNRCGCCGHALKYACAVVHTSGNGYWVGRDCASKIERLRRFDAVIAAHTVAMAERIACNKREADFLAANPDFLGVFAWAALPRAPRIAQDMLNKMRRFGNLSEAQMKCLEKIKTQDEERRANATGKVVEGRQTVRGIVRKATAVEDEFTRDKKTLKLLVDLGTGVKLYGNGPEYLDVTEITLAAAQAAGSWHKVGNQINSYSVVQVGDTVEFTATVTTSKNDELFGFWKRPIKFTVISKATTEQKAA